MSSATGQASILLASGDPKRAKALREELEREGHRVEEVTPAGVVAAARNRPPDVLLLTWNSADTSGYELCGDLRAAETRGTYSPIVLVSAESPDEDAVMAGILAGADDVVAYPNRAKEFRARLTAQLRNKRRHDMLPSILDEARKLEHQARTDPLTGLMNRRSLEQHLDEVHAAPKRASVIFVDLDHFKKVNDTYGHAVGDDVLKSTADVLKQGTRPTDAVGRMGGEEFVVVLPGADRQGAEIVAERLRTAVEALRFPENGYPRRVTASFGVATFDPNAPDASSTALLERADAALYEAKKSGRNRAAFAAPLAASSDEASTEIVTPTPPPVEPPPKVSEPARAVQPTKVTAPQTTCDVESTLIERITSGRAALPQLPSVVSEALALANDPDAHVGAMVSLVEKDPPIATRLISLANSALFLRGQPVTDISGAIGRLGLNRTRDLLLQIAYSTTLASGFRYRRQVSESFNRSVLCGSAARLVCSALGEEEDWAYMAGLVHDIGEARVYKILGSFDQPPRDLDLVAELVERHHAQAGAELAEFWTLPDLIIDAARLHHSAPADAPHHVKVVMTAGAFVDAVQAAGDTPPSEIPETPLTLSEDAVRGIFEKLAAADESAAA